MNIENTSNQTVDTSIDRKQLEREAIIDTLDDLKEMNQLSTFSLIDACCTIAEWVPTHPSDFIDLINVQVCMSNVCEQLDIIGLRLNKLINDIQEADEVHVDGLFKHKIVGFLAANDERSVTQLFKS